MLDLDGLESIKRLINSLAHWVEKAQDGSAKGRKRVCGREGEGQVSRVRAMQDRTLRASGAEGSM